MSPSDPPARVDGGPIDCAGLSWPADYPAEGPPGKTALIFEDRSLTYAMLDRLSSAFVSVLRERGVAPGDRIAFIGRNSEIYFPVYFGNLRAGTILVPLNWRYAVPEIAFVLADAAPKLVICDLEFRDDVRAAAPDIALLSTEGEGGLRDLIEQAEPAAWNRHDPDATAMLMYTSGTTGRPKGAEITHRAFALARHVERISPYYSSWTADDVALSPMPNFHMGALSWLLGGLMRGLTCVITADTTAPGLVALCRRHRITSTFIVPTVIGAIIETLAGEPGDGALPSLREVHYGASPMDVGLLQAAIERLGCNFVHHYGMTENTGTATRLGPADHDPARPHLLRSVGKPQAGLSLEVRRADGSVARCGEAGEIWLRSPTVMRGYWNREAAAAEAVVDGWYRTGDGGLVEDGFLYLTDRIKDMIVSGGENIYPVEVEEALRSHPAVADVAVFGHPDPRWGEMVVAAVEFRPGTSAETADLSTHLRSRVAGYKIPKRFLLGAVLPRTATGKVRRGEMRLRTLSDDC